MYSPTIDARMGRHGAFGFLALLGGCLSNGTLTRSTLGEVGGLSVFMDCWLVGWLAARLAS